MGKLNKPEVDYIKGISPAIAVEQKVSQAIRVQQWERKLKYMII